MVKVLLAQHADPSLTDQAGNNAFHAAAQHQDVLEVLGTSDTDVIYI